jgi:hypothetical protein
MYGLGLGLRFEI